MTGYKSSTGHYGMRGVFPLSRTLNSLGPLARSVADCVLADAVLRGLGAPLATPLAIDRVELVVTTNVVFDEVEPAVADNFERALQRLAKAGFRIVRKPVPQFDAILSLNAVRGPLIAAEALHFHWDGFMAPRPAPWTHAWSSGSWRGEKMTAVDLVEILLQRQRLIAENAALLGQSFFAFPTTPHVAMEIAPAGSRPRRRSSAPTSRRSATPCSATFSTGAACRSRAVAMPAAMPTGFLLSAQHGRDTDVLSVALAAEALVRGDFG